VNYSYDQRYNATVTLRADGSSRFAKGHQWGYFPSVGLSWNVDKERFFHGGKDFSYLKLRASAGVVGNQEIGDYKYIANIVPETYYFNDQAVTAYVVDNMANPDLKWETTASYNVGVDLGLFDGRLNFTLDAYYKKTSDLLLEVPVENVTGFSSALRNIGSVSNKGLEFEVNGTIVDRKNWKWRASANLATNTNKVESLGDADYFLPSFEGIGTLQYMTPLIVKRGEPLGTFYGYKFAGIVQADEDISKLPTQTTEALAPGVVKYQDVNGDGVVNEEDRTTLGNSQPKFTGGFNTTLNYRHWDLFISLHGSYGNKLFNTLRARFEKTSTAYNSLKSVANRWTESNPSNLIGKASNSTSIVTDDRYVEDASFLKVRNIALGYTLPVKSLTPDAKIRLFVSLQNFFTFTGYKGYDPESNRNGVDESNGLYQGVDFGTYPSAKTVQLGFSLTL
jgi:TonB-linked SusC/RagA family outer membrane protein